MKNLSLILFAFIFFVSSSYADEGGKYDSLMSVISDMPSYNIIEMADSTEKEDSERALVMWLTICHRFTDKMSN